MRNFSVLVIGLGLLGFVSGSGGQEKQPENPHVADTPPRTPAEEQKLFHLPAGFVIELVAAEPDINKPINIAFDAKGRLWVTGSVEYPFPAEKGKTPRDRVTILSDFAANGQARKIDTYADGLNIPIGVLPLPGAKSALVYSIPNLYLMTGNDKADRRDVLYTGYGYRDTHGMTGEFVHGFDGWVYCCHGYANNSTVKGKSEQSISMHSGNTYRIKPDGSKIEYFTHGQVNPFGLTLDEAGNVYSCDCHSRPIYQLLKGAWYPSFEKPHDGLGFGPEMLQHDHGSTAIAGIAYYADDLWPKEYQGNIFIGNVVTNRINRDRLEWHGSSPKAVEMPDFVKCDDPWFRPVDIKLGPDGNLYVADFYNRIIGHYEVPLNHPGRDREKGRIWRIRYTGANGEAKARALPDFTKVGAEALVDALKHANLSTRLFATHELVHRGGNEVIERMAKAMAEGSTYQKVHGLWVLERLGKLSDAALLDIERSKSSLLRVHAMRVLAEREKWSPVASELVFSGVLDKDRLVQRVAAEALGAHPSAGNVGLLLEVLPSVPANDTHLLHAIRMALRDQLRQKETCELFAKKDLKADDARALADVCLGVRTPESAGFLKRYLDRWEVDKARLPEQCHYIARFSPKDSDLWLLDFMRRRLAGNVHLQGQVLKRIVQGTQERGVALDQNVVAFAANLTGNLLDSEPAHVELGIDLAGTLRVREALPALLKLVTNPRSTETIRKNALVALLAVEPRKNTTVLADLLNNPEEPIALREQIATSLAATNQAEAHMVLIKALESAPAPLQATIALGMAGSTQGAEKLLQAVANGKASARLLQERPIELRLQQARVANVKERLAQLTKGLPTADQRMQELLAKRRNSYLKFKADPQIGVKVFEKHCATCHQIANRGSKIAPQLDGIGSRGLERLLEDTLDPNRNVDQAFRATSLVLDNGQIVNGLFLRQEGKILIMADAQGKEVRIAADSVQERNISPLSPMPGNFAEQIPEEEFYHLLAYLLAQRVKD